MELDTHTSVNAAPIENSSKNDTNKGLNKRDNHTAVATRHEEHCHIAPRYRHRRHSYDVVDDDNPPPSRDMEKPSSCFVYISLSFNIAKESKVGPSTHLRAKH